MTADRKAGDTHDDHDDHDHGEAHGHNDHDHGEAHNHSNHDDHDHGGGIGGFLKSVFHLHGHTGQRQALASDTAFAANEEGIRTVWIALAALTLTTVIQIVIFGLSRSAALLADTIHNFGDALNSIPLLIAFYLARRTATRRYTYGFGKAEDVAGIFIVLSIVVSAGLTLYESFQKLFNPQPMQQLGWVAAAAVIGFVGNEAVALLQIRTGRRIGSVAMVADGIHARTDGITSLAVLAAVGGTALGFPVVDPIIGLVIGLTILFIARDAVKSIWYRLMDAVEPELVERIEEQARIVPQVVAVHDTRVRWLGHRLQVDLHIIVNEDLPTRASHQIAEDVRHTLLHDQPQLTIVNIHVDPCGHGGADPHREVLHHDRPTATGRTASERG